VRCHGALVDVGGVGVLLVGSSGVGKSECALELVTRGHRLVADDVVELERRGAGVWGRAAARIGHHIEIRGLGILSVPDLFGSEAVCERSAIDLVCRLDRPGEGREYERIGIVRATELVAGVELPAVTLPARPGGSMATVVDVAARDHRLRARGINAAARLDARLRGEMQS
jgi:HPr kinase/phosphorylase